MAAALDRATRRASVCVCVCALTLSCMTVCAEMLCPAACSPCAHTRVSGSARPLVLRVPRVPRDTGHRARGHGATRTTCYCLTSTGCTVCAELILHVYSRRLISSIQIQHKLKHRMQITQELPTTTDKAQHKRSVAYEYDRREAVPAPPSSNYWPLVADSGRQWPTVAVP